MIPKEVLINLVRWKKEKAPVRIILEQVRKLGYNLSIYKINKMVDEYNNSLYERSGIYLLLKDKQVMYIGQSVDLGTRLDAHHYGFGLDVLCIDVPKANLNLVENRLIRRFNPPFNGKFKKKIKMVTIDNLDTMLT